MNKITLGIILPGNPDRVQKPMRWLKILELFYHYGWIISFIATLVFAVMWLKSDNKTGDLYFDLCKFFAFIGISTFFLWMTAWNEERHLGRCPYCRHFRTMRRITANRTIKVSTHDITRKVTDHHSGIAFDLKGNSALVFNQIKRTEHGTETKEEYTYLIHCKHCGCVSKVKDGKTSQSF